jgi:hypothetical protein
MHIHAHAQHPIRHVPAAALSALGSVPAKRVGLSGTCFSPPDTDIVFRVAPKAAAGATTGCAASRIRGGVVVEALGRGIAGAGSILGGSGDGMVKGCGRSVKVGRVWTSSGAYELGNVVHLTLFTKQNHELTKKEPLVEIQV